MPELLRSKADSPQARRFPILPILILDEPTGGSDAEAERTVLNAVRAATRERAPPLILQRRTWLELMDDIVVLENGRIVARRTPREICKPWMVSPGSCSIWKETKRKRKRAL